MTREIALGSLRLQPEWRITLFVLVLVPLMVNLGFWQLSRAGEKAALAEDFARKQAQVPAPLATVAGASAAELAYLPVRVRGQYLEEYFLLDNRMRERKYGNEVVAVFSVDGGGLVLVNRGWVAADPARRSLPLVATPAGVQEITGHVYVAPGDPYLLGDQPLPAGWPKQVQAIEVDKMSAALPGDLLLPYPVRIDSGQPGALAVNWQVINVAPEKHTGYAVQWFTMATVLALIYLLRCSNLWQLLRGRPQD
jgi:cytochrome oxidase assembly protein ShyY1